MCYVKSKTKTVLHDEDDCFKGLISVAVRERGGYCGHAGFTNSFKHTVWRKLPTTDVFKIITFTGKRCAMRSYVGVLVENDGCERVYYIKGHTKKSVYKHPFCLKRWLDYI